MEKETKQSILLWTAVTLLFGGMFIFGFSAFTDDYDTIGKIGVLCVIVGLGTAMMGVAFGLKVHQFAQGIALLMAKSDDIAELVLEHEDEARRLLELAGLNDRAIDDVIEYLKARYDDLEEDEPGE